MLSLAFSYDGPVEIEEGADIDYRWELEIHRFGLLSVGVEFTVGVEAPNLEGQTVYRLVFELLEGSPEAEQPDRALRELAARAGPVTLFPYVRETFSSAASRCGLRFVLPFQNVGTLFSADEIELPAVEESDMARVADKF
jgi:preprotein translocase subunit SecB